MNTPTTFRDGYVIRDQFASHFLTFTICEWIDLFTRKVYRDIIIQSFEYSKLNKGLKLNEFVIMSNHIHLIASTKEPFKLSDFIRDFKAHTHRAMPIVIESDIESRRHWMIRQFKYYDNRNSNNDTFQIWIQDNYPEEILSQEMLYSKLNYIHENPVRAGHVSKARHYFYSIASNYLTGKGILEIDFI
jgi:putative transposase